MVVGALIFVLGIDLVKEALWDTRHRVSTSEYITITSIMICMTVWDFVTGVLFGIVVSCQSRRPLCFCIIAHIFPGIFFFHNRFDGKSGEICRINDHFIDFNLKRT